jgi:DNA-3-methyladenine glycosylase I
VNIFKVSLNRFIKVQIFKKVTYCDYIKTLKGDQLSLHKEYHDNHYGFPIDNDDELFERLMFEINQAGLNWILILKKQHNFRKAFDNYDINKVAAYDHEDFLRLMNDQGIIRNRLKINAAIENARVILKIRNESGSFKKWLDYHSEKIDSLDEWTKLFRKTFKFTGVEIVNEFLMSTAYLPGSHSHDCPVYEKIEKIKTINAGRDLRKTKDNEKEGQGSN